MGDRADLDTNYWNSKIDEWAVQNNFDPLLPDVPTPVPINIQSGVLPTTVPINPIPNVSSGVQPVNNRSSFFNYDPEYIKAQEERAGKGFSEGIQSIDSPLVRDIGGLGYKAGTVAAIGGGIIGNLLGDLADYIFGGEKMRKFDMDKLFTSLEDAWGKSKGIPLPPKKGAPATAAAPTIAPVIPIAPPPKEITIDADGNIVTKKATSPITAPETVGAKAPPPLDVGAERDRFYKSLTSKLGFDPVAFDPVNEAQGALLKEYEARYGPSQMWLSLEGTGGQFRRDLAALTQQFAAKKQTGLDQLKFAMDMFEKKYVPTILKQGELARFPGGETVKNYPPEPTTVIGANQVALGPGGAITRGNVLAKEGETITIPGYGTISGGARPETKEAADLIVKEATGGIISNARKNFLSAGDAFSKIKEGSKDEKTLLALPATTDPKFEEKKNLADQYRSFLNITSLQDEKQRAAATSDESFYNTWGSKDELARFHQVLGDVVKRLRGGKEAEPAAPGKPVVGGKTQINGTLYKIKKINSDGTMDLTIDNTVTTPAASPIKK